MLPVDSGKTQSAVSSTHIYVPDKISIVADHEIPLIKEGSTAQTHQTYWQLIAISTVCVIAILVILYLSFRSSVHNMATRCFSSRTVPEPSTAEQNTSSPRLNREEEPTLQTKATLKTMSHLRLIHSNQPARYTEICF